MKSLNLLGIYLFFSVLIVGCNEKKKEVEIGEVIQLDFTFPKDFEGVFRISESEAGQVVNMAEGKVNIDVPESGDVVVFNADFLNHFFETSWKRRDVEIIPERGEEEFTKLYTIASTSEGFNYFFLGTPSGFERVEGLSPFELKEQISKRTKHEDMQ